MAEGAYRARGRTPPVCREMVRTLLHGHRYDGSRATRELGLAYTPARETFRRTIAWALDAGLVTRRLPGWESSGRRPGYVGLTRQREGAMERDDDTTTDRPAGDAATGGHSRDEHPAGPSQPDEGGFEEGAEQEPDSRADARLRARRRTRSDDDTGKAEGRYSRGTEDPATEEASNEGRFSEGIEQLPHDGD